MDSVRKRLRREDGAAAVEFALISGVLVMLIFGMLQFGVAFFQVQNLRAATREAARVAAVRAPNDVISDRLVSASSGMLPDGYAGFTVAPGLCTRERTGQEVTVEIVNGQLPGNIQNALSLDVPFLPPYQLDPVLSGTFRCE